jgi:enoyl-CoA hydratase/carnithine racemase
MVQHPSYPRSQIGVGERLEDDLDAGIEQEKLGFASVFASQDAHEGISAFLQKRTPRFQGK